jgi:hypothetical protein
VLTRLLDEALPRASLAKSARALLPTIIAPRLI